MRRLSLLLALAALLPLGCGGDEPPKVLPPRAPPATYDADGHPVQALRPRTPRPPNLILLVIDTLRADALDAVAPEQAAMPALSRRAAHGVTFTQASTCAPWTQPALMSLLTGLLPRSHGVTSADIPTPDTARNTTWAEVLRSAFGYQTAGWFGALGPQMLRLLGEGFDVVADDFQLQTFAARLEAWESTREPARPFFMVCHSYEAHDPYGAASHPVGPFSPEVRAAALEGLLALGPDPDIEALVGRCMLQPGCKEALRSQPRFLPWHPEVRRFLWSGLATRPGSALPRQLEQGYRAGLAWVDGLVEGFFQTLERRGLLENSVVVVTADHGEAFGEHGMLEHGNQLYDELLRIPLVITGPAPFQAPTLVEGSVGLTDLMPTFLDLLGAPPPDGADGVSLLGLVAHDGPGRPIEAEEVRTHMRTMGESVAVLGSLRSTAWKYICTYDLSAGTLVEEVYDLRADPGESRSRADPDGLVRQQPWDEPFCRGVERIRDRIWESASSTAWKLGQGYVAGVRSADVQRPLPECDPTPPR